MMESLKRVATNPLALLVCLVAGGLAGWLTPSMASYAAVVAQIYLGVVGMAALPLMVVATFFGLRRTLALPLAGKRIFMIVGWALVLVASCAILGTALGTLAGTGKGLSQESRQRLGLLVQSAGGDAANAEFPLMEQASATGVAASQRSYSLPNNFFRTLVDGKAAGIILCSVLFGLAFAALSKEQTNDLASILEASYRTFEIIIASANIFIPVLVFGMAAFFVANAERQTMVAMGSFLAAFFLLSATLAGMAIALIRKQAGVTTLEVLSALKAPALVSLTSASSTASIPGTIYGMSARLGFSRGVVELVTPLSAVFLRTGAALYFSLMAVFVANLYERPVSLEDAVLICVGASLAAMASAGNNSVANLGFAGMVLSMLKLPVEAALALFVAIDVVCEGPRNLLTLVFSCALIALVSEGLPSERLAAKSAVASPPEAPVKFSFSRAEVVVAASCFFLASVLVIWLGVGVGMRSACETGSTGRHVSGADVIDESVRRQ